MFFLALMLVCVSVLSVLRPPPRNSAKTKREDGTKRKDVSYLYGDVGSLLSNDSVSNKGPSKSSN